MALSQKAISQLNDLANFLSFTPTWHLKKFLKMHQQIIALFYGNQTGKTGSICYQYVLRVLGKHPVPKKNVMYFECETRNQNDIAPHGYYNFREPDGTVIPGWEKGTWNLTKLPQDGKCPFCGGKIVIHQRHSKKIRLCSETLPGDKEATSKDGTTTAETKNTIYPEMRKWMPPFLIKRDITFRNPALIIHDPNAGMELNGTKNKGDDIVFDFVSYSQSIQAGAGVQRMSVYCDEEPPKDFYDEQLPRLLAEDGDFLLGLTPANGLCFDEQTEILSDNGWVNNTKLKVGQYILTYSVDKKDYEWMPVTRIYNEKVNGGMTSLKCRGFDALVTDNHRWLVENKVSGKFSFVETSELKKHQKIYRAIKNTIECVQVYDDWLVELAGWFLTDGTAPKGRRYIRIDQSFSAYPEKCSKIAEIVKNIKDVEPKIKLTRYIAGDDIERHNMSFTINGETAAELRTLFPNRELTSNFVFSLTKHQQQLLYDSLMDGDGCRNGDSDKLRGEEKTIDAFQILCVLLGKKSSKKSEVTSHGTTVWKSIIQKENKRYKPYTHVCSLKKETVKYEGRIWCPTTKNGTVIARRNGSIYISGNSWTFDDIFEKAQVYFRTEKVVEFLNETDKSRKVGVVEMTGSARSIAVLQAATDDNPTLGRPVIEQLFASVDDPDTMATRRFGIHRQVSGRIFKEFDYKTHYIDFNKFFPTGMFHDWNHYRMIDYHPHNKWAVVWLSVSPQNEAFVWNEWAPDPEKIVTRMIANEMALLSTDYKFKCDLIDPRAAETQTNTGTTTVDDLNDAFSELKREGICKGAYWETWDTKGTRGREVVRERLKNSKEVGIPFANKRVIDGATRYLPTLWIANRCPQTAQSMKQWRLESWARSSNNVNKDRKEAPAQKFSHFCTAIEAVFKDNRCRPPLIGQNREPERPAPRYFQGRRAA